MKNYLKYYRVFKHDTAVTEVLVNDFKPVKAKKGLLTGGQQDVLCTIPYLEYSLPTDDESMFYDYLEKHLAMEKAKSGALTYINQMINEIEQGIKKLMQYRLDHYDDLNTDLLAANIHRLKKEMNIKS